MEARSAYLTIFTALATASCATTPTTEAASGRPPTRAPSPAPAPAPQAAANCAVPETRATCHDKWCPVLVFKDHKTQKWHVAPYHLKVTKPQVTIQWILFEDGAKFVDAAKGIDFKKGKYDGVEKPGDGGKIDKKYPSDQIGEDPREGASGKSFAVKFKNHQAEDIKYDVNFDTGAGTFTCDPTINNDGGGE